MITVTAQESKMKPGIYVVHIMHQRENTGRTVKVLASTAPDAIKKVRRRKSEYVSEVHLLARID